MASLHLVRHGQASFGAANYDQLSELGIRQCRRLGEYLAGRGQRYAAALTGTLQRQRQSHQALIDGLGACAPAVAQAEEWPGLNEYDSAAVLATVHDGPVGKATTPEQYREHFRLLRQGLTAWMQGRVQPQGMPSYADFVAGVHQALDRARNLQRELGGDADVLIVSSGGPIATAVGQVLQTPPEVTIDLNMRLRNSAVCELAITPKRLALVSYNHLPHLDDPALADWRTHT